MVRIALRPRAGRAVLLLLLLEALGACAGSARSGAAPTPTPRPESSSPSLIQPRRKKVLLIGIDGVRVDVLERVHAPNFARLVADGAFSDEARTRMPTMSGPCWSSMLTGVWSDKHGVKDNKFVGKRFTAYPDFLTRLEQIDPRFSTFAALDWPPLGSTIDGGPLISDSIDVKMLFEGDRLGYPEADARAVAAAAHYLADGDPDAAFVYMGNPDEVAHALSPLSPEYRAALEEADRHVGTLLLAVRSRPTYAREDWLILMSTDHGHRDKGGHGGPSTEELRIFFLASGPSAVKARPESRPETVDVAVTALAHLGVAIDSTWALDGHVIGLRRD